VSSRASICFVAPKAYPALSGRDDLAYVGGAQRQQVLLAEELIRRGHRVSFVVLDHGQTEGEEIRGIGIFKCYRLDSGRRRVRFLHPRLTGLWAAMGRADADVYYQRGADAETGLVGRWCRRNARAFIFAVAHDAHCRARLPLMSSFFERLLCRYGLRLADAVISQTARQQELLSGEFGIRSTVIKSCFSWRWNAEDADQPAPDQEESGNILWVGRLSEEKRPTWLIRLATELPSYRFEIVGRSNDDSAFGRSIIRQLEPLRNVSWRGYVPHSEMVAAYRRAALLLCTSESEGFPNVFLEAWACGKGVLSSVDPDGVITRFRMGCVARRYEDMKRHLIESGPYHAVWGAYGREGHRYVQLHHGTSAAVDGLVQVMAQAMRRFTH
jgi:glycosyltransferase involved in cell wall biosynthesis